jgi:hypothetical protein
MVDLANRITEQLTDPAPDRLNGETEPPPRPAGATRAGGSPVATPAAPAGRRRRASCATSPRSWRPWGCSGSGRSSSVRPRAEQGNLGAAQFLARLLLGATPPLPSELPAELLPDPAAELYVPPGPTPEELARRARAQAALDVMGEFASGEDV